MLDPLPLDEKEITPLKCEACGLYYDILSDIDNIEETGRCIDCEQKDVLLVLRT